VVRLQQRFIENVSGVIPQVRYLIYATVPLDRTFYLSFSEAVRVNLTD